MNCVFERQHRLAEGARRQNWRRAFSLLELLTVLTLIGLLSGMAVMRLGETAFATTDANGFAQRLARDLAQTRRRSIATGDDHSLSFSRSSGIIVGYGIFDDVSTQLEETVPVPNSVTVTSASDVFTFDFGGAVTSGANNTIRVDGPEFYWTVTLYYATGSVVVDMLAQP